ncbi:Mitochondrial 28S ribosomal protein S34 [Trinorchestia longiramus]|nr:Mitochondrial 28S ribosomal protein S34 [Trinorchestia longiramus]
MPFFKFGVKSPHVGRSLWDIILTQPKLGVGRLIRENHLRHFPQPSFLKLKEVNANMNEYREMQGNIIAERWHRGNYCGLENVTRIARITNYSLVLKAEEENLWNQLETCKKPDVVVLPSTFAFPPVFKMFMEQRHKMSVDRCPLQLDPNLPDNFYVRVAEDGEEPTVSNEEVDGFGTTSQPQLFEDVPLEKATIPPPKNSIRVPTIDVGDMRNKPFKILEKPLEEPMK